MNYMKEWELSERKANSKNNKNTFHEGISVKNFNFEKFFPKSCNLNGATF